MTDTPANPPPAPRTRRPLYLAIGIGIAIIVLDQLTKALVRARMPVWESSPAEGIFRITYVQNSGAAFGLFQSMTVILGIVSIIAIAGLVLALRYPPLRTAWASLALGLLLGGSTGNLIDRLRFGYVTDFIDIGFPHGWRFYTFNVADSAITVGAILIALVLLRMGSARPEAAPGDASSHEGPAGAR